MAKDHAANIDQYGVLTALEILEGMDQLYRVSMTFQSLNAALCGLQQRAAEMCQDYYNRFTQITVLLWERHLNRFCPGKLARMSKDCFYAGLWTEHRPMVVHMKDCPNSTPLDLLAALMENEQNDMLANTCYPPATSSKTAVGVCHTDHSRPPGHMDKQDHYMDRKSGGFTGRQVQLGQDEHARDCGDAGEDGYVICPVQLDAESVEDSIRQFLGATGYFRRFIKGYANIAKPLNNLLSGINSKLKSCFVWLPPAAVLAFQELKLKCITAPVLAFADFHKPFLLETDTSGDGLGAVLSQKQEDGHYHPVTYASHGLKGGELRYHSSKLEFLALKWVIMEQFREYLQYQPFHVKTNNNPLTYVMSIRNLDAIGHCWVASLAGFNFTIEYLKGTDNKVADALSRVVAD